MSLQFFAEGTIKDKRAVEPFIKALKDDEAGEWLRVTIVSALAKIKDERAVELLIEILRKDRAEGMRRVAAEALGEIGDGRAIEPLKEALKDEEVGAAVKDALKKIQKGVKKKEEGETKQYRYANPNLMARAEKEAMAKENLREALKTLTSIYNESGGPRFAGLESYIAGKLDACGVAEQHLRRDKGYTKAALRKMEEYDAGRPGDTFNQGKWEVLSWALARLEENA